MHYFKLTLYALVVCTLAIHQSHAAKLKVYNKGNHLIIGQTSPLSYGRNNRTDCGVAPYQSWHQTNAVTFKNERTIDEFIWHPIVGPWFKAPNLSVEKNEKKSIKIYGSMYKFEGKKYQGQRIRASQYELLSHKAFRILDQFFAAHRFIVTCDQLPCLKD